MCALVYVGPLWVMDAAVVFSVNRSGEKKATYLDAKTEDVRT